MDNHKNLKLKKYEGGHMTTNMTERVGLNQFSRGQRRYIAREIIREFKRKVRRDPLAIMCGVPGECIISPRKFKEAIVASMLEVCRKLEIDWTLEIFEMKDGLYDALVRTRYGKRRFVGYAQSSKKN